MNKVLSTVVVLAMTLSGCGTAVDNKESSATPEEPPLSKVTSSVSSRDVNNRSADFPVSRSDNRPSLSSIKSITAKPKQVKLKSTKPVVRSKTQKSKYVVKTRTKTKYRTVKKPVRSFRPVPVGGIARCIGKYESGNNPKAQNPSSSASGYFQFTDGTWNNFKGYARAKYAPLSVQLKKFYIVWNGGKGASNWTVYRKCI